jgi:hypothetical protein
MRLRNKEQGKTAGDRAYSVNVAIRRGGVAARLVIVEYMPVDVQVGATW